jgi:hypothetical protein
MYEPEGTRAIKKNTRSIPKTMKLDDAIQIQFPQGIHKNFAQPQ